ncbi:MAG: hypothetical protein LUI13_13535 [Lachnospiraceae bacterium]|nr:hypothetical protein [Lachnospiraceae bacterium]
MEELELKQQTELKTIAMGVGYLPSIPEEELRTAAYQKYPLANLSAMGTAFQPLVSGIQSVVSGAGGSGLYYVNTKGLKMMQFSGSSKYLGSLPTETGAVGGGQAELTQLPCDPTMLSMAAALMNIEKKLDSIQQMQQEMMDFLKAKEKAKLRGNINTLIDVVNNYKFNWNNEKYKTNKHILVQDIRRDAEQSIQLFREKIRSVMEKRSLIHSDQEVNAKLRKIQDAFRDYQMALYQFSLASFLEVMLLGNFDESYLKNVILKIEELAYQFRELYTDCYNRLEDISKSSVQTVFTGGASGISKGAGKVISRIPVISKGPVDELLLSAGDKLGDMNAAKTDKAMHPLIEASMSCTVPFVQGIEKISRIYNEPMNVFFDSENIYIAD